MILFDDNQSILGALALESEFTPTVLTAEQFSAEIKLYSANTLFAVLDVTISLNKPVSLTSPYTKNDLSAMTVNCRTANALPFSFPFPSEELVKELVLNFIQQDIFMNELQTYWEFAKDKLPKFAFIQKTGELQEHVHFKFVKLLLSIESFDCLLTWKDKQFCRFKLFK